MVDTALLNDALIAAALLVAIGGAFLYLIHWTRRRRAQRTSEPVATRAELEDRAFNAIAIARAAADRLSREGLDVAAPRRLIDSADAARRRGDADTALGLAKSAQATLTKLRESPTGGRELPSTAAPGPERAWTPPPGPDTREGETVGDPLAPAAADPTSGASSTPRLPPNKAASRFQLGLLDEELAARAKAGPETGDLEASRQVARDGHEAFDRGDYTEALRLALRGRRRLGSRLETLPAGPSAARAATGPVAVDAPAPPSEAVHCPVCGQPQRAGDRFCRGCGASRDSPRCPACGERLAGDDRFCGVCGAPTAPSR